MVSFDKIQASNTKLPTHLTAVFVGGTSGIGEYTLKAFAKHCANPRAYFIGRSQSRADRISRELRTINPRGTYTFISADTSLLANVDKVCADLLAAEPHINLLFLTTGTLQTGIETSEDLGLLAALNLHTRTRFMLNLLPRLRSAPHLRRIVTVFAGTKEGPIMQDDMQTRKLKLSDMLKGRGHMTSLITLTLEELSRRAPEVSLMHNFPGSVRGNLKTSSSVVNAVFGILNPLLGPLVYQKNEVVGESQLFMATSARFPPRERGVGDGVVVGEGVEISKGTDGGRGSGVYVADEKCDEGDAAVLEILNGLRKEGLDKVAWEHVRGEFLRVTGKESI
ncbi:hypothetical protein K491DRAFT_676355 [Lophiostoma macrostomum CBS 122681]|uniref:NAD(P)-binding protein n=1 Tax=Lophiostoma macrostomum CBS 122681 TaxID=1314788 RepID=A0A6A6THY9_9PLEO|nr:hypothetical protein K491DRAFT_676355 [Lophiostoma macrostomum CBS 122681]